jgi:isoleucyl-tRNA synthetase
MVAFVDKLTNWYIRRSRRRFWKSDDDADKASAYATLYRVLVTFAKSLAPVLPYVTEAIYRNLVAWDGQQPESIHLCDMPVVDESIRDAELEEQMTLAMRACALGRMLRNRHNLKVRQPLQRVFLLPPDEHSREELTAVSDLIAEELNIKDVVLVEDESDISEVSYKPNFRSLGPRFGKRMKEVSAFVAGLTGEQVHALREGQRLEVAGDAIGIDDIDVQRREREDVVVAVEENLAVGLDVHLTDELIAECGAREFVNRVQNMRKDAGLDVADRIRLWVQGGGALEGWVTAYRDYVAGETLAEQINVGQLPANGEASLTKESEVNTEPCTIALNRVSDR